ncbi:MAG: hypothetical protein ABFC80_00090, partial [Coriobacteriales bacterium]
NLLRPCMIMDHPQILRDAVAASGAHPTHEGAEVLLGEFAPMLDAYAETYRPIADKAWHEILAKRPQEPSRSAMAS